MRGRSNAGELRPLRLAPRGKRIGCALALVGCLQSVVGCMPVFRPPRRTDYFRAKPSSAELTTAAMTQAFVPLKPAIPPPEAVPNPTGVNGAGTSEYPLSLEDAIRLGLSNSGVVRVLSGAGVSAADATAYDAEIAEARARVALAAFDPTINSAVFANWINQPPDAVFGPGLSEPTRRDEAGFSAGLTKPWVTGGETRIGYNPPLGYLWLPYGTSGFNPLYSSNVEFAVRQPLLRNAGVAVNKAPIRIAQLRRDDTMLQTKQAVMASVRSITEAYWDLYATTAAFKAIDGVVPLLQRVVTIEQERMNAQRSVRADVAKVQSQLRAVTQQAVQARSDMVQAELRLRNLLGLPPVDGYLLTPTSRPLQAPVGIDVDSSAATALQLRPDVVRERLAVRTREQELLAARNLGRPQLDATGLYRWNGVGNALDDSLHQMISAQWADWQTSLTFSMPLGRRAAAAAIRAATVQLAREKAMLQQATHTAVHTINAIAREAEYNYQLFSEANARLAANGDWLDGSKIRYENPPPSGDDWLLAATNDYLSALRSQADAASDTQKFLSKYNAALARLNEAMGTILDDYGIVWSGECPSPMVGGVSQDTSALRGLPVRAADDYRFQTPPGRPWGAPPGVPTDGPSAPLPATAAPVGLPGGVSTPSTPGVPTAPISPPIKTPAETFFGPSTSTLAPPPMSAPMTMPPGLQLPATGVPPAPPVAPSTQDLPPPIPAPPSTSWGAFGMPSRPSPGVPPAGSALTPVSPPAGSPAERFFDSAPSALPAAPPAIGVESLPRSEAMFGPSASPPTRVPPGMTTSPPTTIQPPVAPSATPQPNPNSGRTPAEMFFGPPASGSRFGTPSGGIPSGPAAPSPASAVPAASRFAPPPAPAYPSPMASSRRTPAERFFGPTAGMPMSDERADVRTGSRGKSPAETFFTPGVPASQPAPPAYPPAAFEAPQNGPVFPAPR